MQANETITDADIMNNNDEIEDIILGDAEIIQEIPMANLISAIAGLVSNWFSNASEAAPISKSKVSKAVSNLFKLVDSSLKQAEATGKIEDYLPTFFEVCDKLIQQEIQQEKALKQTSGIMHESESKALGEICAAMNRLIGGVRHILFKVQDEYIVNLVKGYL